LHLLRISLALLFPLILAVAGCGVTQGTEPPPSQSAPGGAPPVARSNGSVSISPGYVALAPGDKTHFSATAPAGAGLKWLVDGVEGGNAQSGTIDSAGNYTAPGNLPQSENVTVTAELASSPAADNATAVASIIDHGAVYPTANPQVFEYSVYLPAPGKVSVEFGETTDYGRRTWQVSAPTRNGGQVNVLVAGMLAKKQYHLRAHVQLDDGAALTGIDHASFSSGLPLATGTPPATVPVTVSSSGNPAPGIEMWNPLIPAGTTQAFATDLNGNVIWTYTYQGTTLDTIQGIQLLPDGNFLMVISYLSSLTAGLASANPGTINVVREVDLSGKTVREISMDTLNQKLAAAGFKDSDGSAYQLKSFHHNVLALPNGHWVLLAAYQKTVNNVAGKSGPTPVLGDVLVDVDQDLNPDWLWSSFDHLDVNRQPMNFPDWTHSNDMLYSSDDRNLLLSMRHQNWIVKIDFNDGQGSGKVLWRLGEGGDFKLVGGTDPTDWFYAQHGMYYFTPQTAGIFRLGLMDNGNDRIYPQPTGQINCNPKQPGNAQCYSTVPVLEINENDRTATLLTHYTPPPKDFSFFGGNVQQLANGDLHADFCAAAGGSIVQELDPTASHVVWQGTTPNANNYHVERLPSLYPGVQW
jgi:arylsulfate sulfotransferase